MIGAGVFSAWGPAAAAAGGWLLIGLLLAAGVAYCNAVASAQLAAQYPTSGGTYVYGRERLGPAWGFLAGWGFVIGKTASSAAMALTFAAYLLPQPGLPQRLLAVAAVIGLTAVNYRGITRTARPGAPAGGAVRRGVGCLRGGRGRRNPVPWRGSARRRRARRIWRAAISRAALLRLRRLCPDRHAGRGGSRAGTHHPPRHSRRAGYHGGDLPRGRGHGAGSRGCPGAGRQLAAARHGSGSRERRLGAARRAGRGRGGEPRRAAGADRRRWTHRAGHGPQRRPAALAGLGPSALSGARPCGAGAGRGDQPAGADHRPARSHRLLVVRRPHLLRHRQRRSLYPDAVHNGAGPGSSTSPGCWAACCWW